MFAVSALARQLQEVGDLKMSNGRPPYASSGDSRASYRALRQILAQRSWPTDPDLSVRRTAHLSRGGAIEHDRLSPGPDAPVLAVIASACKLQAASTDFRTKEWTDA
jgi:hypothetical protein